MRHIVFEQAAAEARVGISEIDAEIDRLKARRELLEVLETISRQLLTVMPMSIGPMPVRAGNNSAITIDTPGAEPSSVSMTLPEG
jgi:hypothetical protein